MKSLWMILGALFLASLPPAVASAVIGQHCLVKPSQLEDLTNKMLMVHQIEKRIFPESSVIQFEATGTLAPENGAQEATYEGIFRPEEDGFFSLTPLPFMVIELRRSRELFYVCAHTSTENPRNNYMILYFLRGYRMGPRTWDSFLGDLLFNSVKVKPVSITPLGTSGLKKLFSSQNGFNPLGIFLIPIEITDTVQRALTNALSTFTKVGVERITLTSTNLELASGVDLERPHKALLKKNIALKPKP